ncbi:MAG: hypothetical protein AB8C02_14820 [Halioglobus sp.]
MSLVLVACGGGGGSSEAEQTNALVGIWEHVYPATQCVETNEFRMNGEFVGVSLDAIVTGFYSFEESVAQGSRHELEIEIFEDNEQADCEGRNVSTVGRFVTVYVSFLSPDSIAFYSEREGGSLLIDFVRIN